MARKSVHFNVVFRYPKGEDERLLLSKTIGNVHTKIIKEVIDKKIVDIGEKNKILTEIQKKLSAQKL